MLTKRMEKKLDDNYTRTVRIVKNKSWRQHLTKRQLYGKLPPVTKTIQIKRTCVLLWTPSHDRAKVGRPARTYIQQLGADTGCSLEELLRAMEDRDEW